MKKLLALAGTLLLLILNIVQVKGFPNLQIPAEEGQFSSAPTDSVANCTPGGQ